MMSSGAAVGQQQIHAAAAAPAAAPQAVEADSPAHALWLGAGWREDAEQSAALIAGIGGGALILAIVGVVLVLFGFVPIPWFGFFAVLLGGLVLLKIGFELFSGSTPGKPGAQTSRDAAAAQGDVAFVPLAMPLTSSARAFSLSM